MTKLLKSTNYRAVVQIVGGSLRRSKSSTCPEFQTTPSGLRCDCCEITGVDAKMKGSHYPSSHHHHLRVRFVENELCSSCQTTSRSRKRKRIVTELGIELPTYPSRDQV
ncbi:hypothetical protein YC2023_120297 [Brassica napus]